MSDILNKSVETNLNNLFTSTNPLEQFEIRDLINLKAPLLGNLQLSLTNIVLYLIISFTIIVILSSITTSKKKLDYNN
jgi:F-type H+-transporting ATPase subunit a